MKPRLKENTNRNGQEVLKIHSLGQNCLIDRKLNQPEYEATGRQTAKSY